MAENEYGNDLITLVDEEGQEHEFELVDTLELDDNRYLALVPAFDPEQQAEEMLEDAGELVILKVYHDGTDEEYLEPIDNEEEFNQIAELFMSRLEDEFDFEEEDEPDGQPED